MCLIPPTSSGPLEGGNRAMPTPLFPAPDRLSIQEVFAKHMTELCWERRSVTSGQTSEALACEGQLSPHFSGTQRGEDTGARPLNPSLVPTGYGTSDTAPSSSWRLPSGSEFQVQISLMTH